MLIATKATATESAHQAQFTWPLKIPIKITSGFLAMRGSKAHAAIDIAAPVGTAVFAIGSGVIDSIWNDPTGGLSLRIKHTNGFQSGYAHLSKNNFFKQGSAVKAGDRIATSGNTGKSTGPHLHLKLRNASGVAVNPLNYLPNLWKKFLTPSGLM